MGYYGSPQHQRDKDARAILQQARNLLRDLDDWLIDVRLRRRASPRIIYKTKRNALAASRLKYRTQHKAYLVTCGSSSSKDFGSETERMGRK